MVSAHHGKKLVLWDTQNKTSQVVGHGANIYSAYFIKGTNKFIWQRSKNNTVYIQDVTGKEIKSFNPGFASYGQVMSPDLKVYIASDEKWNLVKIEKNGVSYLKHNEGGPEYRWIGKLLDLTLVGDHVLSAGVGGENHTLADGPSLKTAGLIRQSANYNRSLWAGVMLWNVKTNVPFNRLDGNVAKTNATLSPDGKYVVAGDENGLGFVWNAYTGKRLLDLDDLKFGRHIKSHDPNIPGDFEGNIRIPPPEDFCFQVMEYSCLFKQNIFAMKFISPTQYLRFTTHVYYAILYDVLDPQPKKYLKLEGFPDVNGYTEAARTDTAPEAGILVVGAAAKSGIRVYKYDKENETLQLVWAPDDFERTSPPDNPKT